MQQKRRLTDKFIKSLKPTDKGYTVADEDVRGLSLRVWPTGRKTWSLRYYPDGEQRRMSLGEYPAELSLQEARDKAQEIRRQVRNGEDPRQMPTRGITLEEATQRWSEDQKARGLKSWKEVKRVVEIHVIPVLGNMELSLIERAHVRRLLEGLRDEQGLTSQVNRVKASLSGIFSWALDAGEIDHYPIMRMRPLVTEKPRDLLLSLDQLVTIWDAASELGSLATPAVKLLILTGARREEVGQMTWDEIDLDAQVWSLPPERHKGKRGLAIPLSTPSVEVLEAIPKQAGGGFVFSRDGATPFAGWPRFAGILRSRANLRDEEDALIQWQLRDIRRAVATGLGDHLHASEEVVGQIMGHSKRSRIGVTATYDRAERLDAQGHFLEAWGRLLAGALDGDVASNVEEFVRPSR
jgi:integrase